jgi:hypothetical protein
METHACHAHQAVAAVTSCARCGRHLCAVCIFDFGGRPYCPDCATAGPTPAERSKAFSGGLISVVLAVLGFGITAGFVVAGAAGIREDSPLYSILSIPWMACGVGGLVTGLVARDGARRTGSVLPLIGTIASGLLVAVQALAVIAGSMK